MVWCLWIDSSQMIMLWGRRQRKDHFQRIKMVPCSYISPILNIMPVTLIPGKTWSSLEANWRKYLTIWLWPNIVCLIVLSSGFAIILDFGQLISLVSASNLLSSYRFVPSKHFRWMGFCNSLLHLPCLT